MISLNYRDSRPIYEQIKDQLRRLILTGAISEKEKLPSVRDLATSLQINPNTIQRAYRELEAEGCIYSLPGKGSFAARPEEAADQRRLELLDELERVVEELKIAGADPAVVKAYVERVYNEREVDEI